MEFLSGIALSIYQVGLRKCLKPSQKETSARRVKWKYSVVSTQNLRLASNICRGRKFSFVLEEKHSLPWQLTKLIQYRVSRASTFCINRMLVPRIDINKDGFVEEAELEIWIRHKMQKWTVYEDVDAIFRDRDLNGDDKISWKEYMTRSFGFTEEGLCLRLVNFNNKGKRLGLSTWMFHVQIMLIFHAH